MRTITIKDDNIIDQARELGHHPGDAEAVAAALEHYIARLRRQSVVDLFGTVDFREDFDPRELRDRDRRRLIIDDPDEEREKPEA